MDHVDIVVNDWDAGQQRIVAEVVLSGGELYIKNICRDQDFTWMIEPDLERLPADLVGSEKLVAFHRLFSGSEFFATEPHDECDCAFLRGESVRMRTEDRSIPQTA